MKQTSGVNQNTHFLFKASMQYCSNLIEQNRQNAHERMQNSNNIIGLGSMNTPYQPLLSTYAPNSNQLASIRNSRQELDFMHQNMLISQQKRFEEQEEKQKQLENEFRLQAKCMQEQFIQQQKETRVTDAIKKSFEDGTIQAGESFVKSVIKCGKNLGCYATNVAKDTIVTTAKSIIYSYMQDNNRIPTESEIQDAIMKCKPQIQEIEKQYNYNLNNSNRQYGTTALDMI